MALPSVQFRDKEKVIEAFEYRQVEAWALWQGKQFLFKGIGVEELTNVLNMLGTSSNAVYTLTVFEDIDDARQIKHNTQHDGSFNFRLNEPNQELEPTRALAYQRTHERLDRIEKLLSEEVEEDDEPETVGQAKPQKITGIPWADSLIHTYLQDPDKLGKLIGVVKQTLLGAATPAVAGGAVGNISNMSNNNSVTASPATGVEQKLERISAALDMWEQADPEYLECLEKIAELSRKNPVMYKLAKQQLQSL